MDRVRVLAISGSLRERSLNSALLRAVAQLAPDPVRIDLYGEAGSLPLFNPDLEGREPTVVRRLWTAVTLADGVLIASPEYAHGVSAVIKNVLDWLVSLPAFYGKPVAVMNAAPRAHHADQALRETLRTMSARVIEDASITVPLLGSGLDEAGIVASPALAAALRAALAAFARSIAHGDASDSIAFRQD